MFLLAVGLAALAAALACRGGGSNPNPSEQVIPVISVTPSGRSCITDPPPEGAPQFSQIDSSRYQTTESGLKFYDVEVGTGAEVSLSDLVEANYAGWLTDGCTFASSYISGEPTTFIVINTVGGWREGIPGMHVGGTRVLELSPGLGYGVAGRPLAIPSNATLIFHVNVVSRLTLEEARATATAAAQATAEAGESEAATATAEAAAGATGNETPAPGSE
jgi:hypothetical protein